MIELVRTNDLVMISLIEGLLTQERVAFFIADQHMSATEGSVGFLPRRIMVDADEAGTGRAASSETPALQPNCVMADATAAATFATSLDAWLDGKLMLRQPLKGHRVGSDAALLAAAAPSGGRVVDVGAGVGAVALAILTRFEAARADLVEIDADLAGLARENAAANGLATRSRIIVADIMAARARRSAGLADGAADLVVANPPFFAADKVRASSETRRARAHVLTGGEGEDRPSLARWIIGSLALLAPGGRFVMIHRPEALAEMLACFERRLGAVRLLPIHPRQGAPAHRLLATGVKGARAPMSIRPGLILHDATGAFTGEADALHRGEATIDWGD